MDYTEAIGYLTHRDWRGSRLGLQRMEELLGRMGNPQDGLRFVHIAGTNGKGSVAAMVSSIMTQAGYRTGLYTSPHLKRYNERIQVDGLEISDADFAAAAEAVRDAVEGVGTGAGECAQKGAGECAQKGAGECAQTGAGECAQKGAGASAGGTWGETVPLHGQGPGGTKVADKEAGVPMADEADQATRGTAGHDWKVWGPIGDHPTEFELLTALALAHFARVRCDIVVMEVGLGGRLDATNVIPVPEVAVITALGMDHTGELGNTLAKIAAEKAGIVKPGGQVVLYPPGDPQGRAMGRAPKGVAKGTAETLPDGCGGLIESRLKDGNRIGESAVKEREVDGADAALRMAREICRIGESAVEEREVDGADAALRMVREICRERGASLTCVDFSKLAVNGASPMGFTFDFDGLEDLRLSLPGDYQPYNAATALTAVKALQGLGWEISEAAIRKGLEEVRWPARFEVVRQGNPTFILDGGHNPQGAQMVADSLRRHFPGRQAIFIFGVMADKDYGAMADAILPLAKRIFTVTPDSPRALPAQELAHFIEGRRAKAAQPPEGAMQAAIGAGPLTGGGCAGRVPQDIEVTPCATIPAAVEAAFAAAGPGDVICAFGSLYMAGDVSDAVRAHGEALT